jgi:two-component system, sensor histidine kinase
MDIDQTEALVRLTAENAKLKKINQALMARVERGSSHPANAYGLFEMAIALDNNVRQRTQELQNVLRSIERSNEALDQAKQLAERANSFKSTFLAFVSHDLLQPLNAARLGLSALMEVEIAPQSQPLMAQVDRALISLEDLIRTLLDISKLDAGVMKPEISRFELERVVGPLRQEFEPLAAARGLRLHIRHTKLCVQSDPVMLRRILQNFLTNALYYTPRGGVVLGYRRRGGKLHIEVIDTGPGIPEDKCEEIFEEFKRGVGSPNEHRGFGLGLSIVRRLALALDHPVSLISRIGHGSVFAVSVPFDALPGDSSVPIEQICVPLHYGLDGARIIIIENEITVSRAMCALLERWGCRTLAVPSSGQALERMHELGVKPDLIIADLRLENGERGPDVIRALQRHTGSSVPALIVTADHSPEASAEAAQLGVEILRKPVKPAQLRSLMAYLLG